jgi:alkylation response protein AidB-like acyl-CoA dehydrogenase
VNDEVVAAVCEFVDRDVVPVASELERRDKNPAALVQRMTELGLFGLTIPEEHGGLGLDLETYALVNIELARGWMAPLRRPQHARRPGLDDRAVRHRGAALAPAAAPCRWRHPRRLRLTEPHAGSDLRAIRTRADRDEKGYAITGQKCGSRMRSAQD